MKGERESGTPVITWSPFINPQKKGKHGMLMGDGRGGGTGKTVSQRGKRVRGGGATWGAGVHKKLHWTIPINFAWSERRGVGEQ